MASLTRADALLRAGLVAVHGYEVDLDLDRGERIFGSRCVVRFGCRAPGATTFVDVEPVSLRGIWLNGRALDPGLLGDGRVELAGLAAENELVVEAEMAYSNDGQGLHRSVDSADGRHYVYGHLFLDAAPRVFACFDQPDLKAPYAVSVTAPDGWVVLGNGAATQVAPGRWRLAPTRPLATYFVTVCAGPYASVRDEHDGIPLGLHARASMRDPLLRNAPGLLQVTRQCLDYYHGLFGIRYPFGEYHQVFVPEFNAGAMENPGCVTFRDPLLYRGAATHDELLTQAKTVAHEMAHMWFGDLVTMRWWDDLWLNESFAEYLSHRTLVAATQFSDAWTDYLVARKVWGYAVERTPSTHPVAGAGAVDAQSALQNFDGISYAKGAAVLRQLISYIGDDAFVRGVRDLLRSNEFGNADLGDFLRGMERASGADLGAWSAAWLGTAKLDVLSVPTRVVAGVYEHAALSRSVPVDAPAQRPHRLDVAGFTGGRELFRFPVAVAGDLADLPSLRGARPPALLVPNAGDLTWATVRLDEASLAALPVELPQVRDDLARAVVWVSLVDGVALSSVDPRLLLRVFCAAWPLESSASVVSRIAAGMVGRLIPTFLLPGEQPAALRDLVGAARRLLSSSPPRSTLALAAARLVGRWTEDVDVLSAWVSGADLPAGLEEDEDFRWAVVRNQAERGLVGEAEIDAALARDPSMSGALSALEARASLPDPALKEWAWGQVVEPNGRSNHEMLALCQGFWDPARPDLVSPYVERYFADVPALAGRVGEDALARVAAAAYPSTVVDPRTVELTERALARDDLSPAVRRALRDRGSMLAEALASRARFAPGPPLDRTRAGPPSTGHALRRVSGPAEG